MPDSREWLIWNVDYQQFWGPDSGGYFGLWGAGLYTETEARQLAKNKDRKDRVQHISEYKDQIENMRGALRKARSGTTSVKETREASLTPLGPRLQQRLEPFNLRPALGVVRVDLRGDHVSQLG